MADIIFFLYLIFLAGYIYLYFNVDKMRRLFYKVVNLWKKGIF